MNDLNLIHRLQKGEESAFRQLVEQYQKPVYNTVLNIIQDQTEAEDAAQEVFIRIYQSIRSFRGESALSTWIYRISINMAMDKVRRRSRRSGISSLFDWFGNEAREPESASCYHPGVKLENKEKAARLFAAIASLPDSQRIAFTMIKVQGMNYEEVCQIMNKNLKAVESLMSRAKDNLQKKLKQSGK